MKYIILVGLCTIKLLFVSQAFGQNAPAVTAKEIEIAPQRLSIGYEKTTHLLFSAPIKSVDRGSDGIMVQKAAGVENVLRLKAARQRFDETNLTVITTDGRLYSFVVTYDANPATLTYQLKQGYSAGQAANERDSPAAAVTKFSKASDNTALVKSLVNRACITKRNINKVEDENNGVKVAIRGLYTASDMFFYKLIFINSSNINYDIEAIRFYIRDRKQVKRTATQEIILQPVSIAGNEYPVTPKSNCMIIAVLPKHPIGRDKELTVEIMEKDGGRNLACKMNNKILLKAKTITAN